MKLSDIDLLKIGNTIQLAGAVFVGEGKMLLCLFPEDRGTVNGLHEPGAPNVAYVPATDTTGYDWHPVEVLDMDRADWDTFIRQTDLLETEVLTKASDGTLAKVILRKSQRNIETGVQWQVFHRDNYRCRYCGKGEGTPLTVDHLVCWEEGGPSTTDNLVAACKKCNKVRGNLSYEEWLRHPRYKELSKGLSAMVRADNEELIGKIRFIPRHKNVRSR